jgi:hypothetical protein
MKATTPDIAELGDDVIARIDALAFQRGLTRAEMLGVLVNNGLDKLEAEQPMDVDGDPLTPPGEHEAHVHACVRGRASASGRGRRTCPA